MVSECVVTVGNLLPKHLPSSFPGCEFVTGVIKINKSQFIILYAKNTQIRQPLLWQLNEAHFCFFSTLKMISHQNSLWPSNIRTISKLFPRLGKHSGFFHAW